MFVYEQKKRNKVEKSIERERSTGCRLILLSTLQIIELYQASKFEDQCEEHKKGSLYESVPVC